MPALGIVDGAMNSVHVSALLALDRGALNSATANHGCRWVLVVDDCILYCTPFSLSLFFVSTSAINADGDADREKIYLSLSPPIEHQHLAFKDQRLCWKSLSTKKGGDGMERGLRLGTWKAVVRRSFAFYAFLGDVR
jgi:hypothetical protein